MSASIGDFDGHIEDALEHLHGDLGSKASAKRFRQKQLAQSMDQSEVKVKSKWQSRKAWRNWAYWCRRRLGVLSIFPKRTYMIFMLLAFESISTKWYLVNFWCLADCFTSSAALLWSKGLAKKVSLTDMNSLISLLHLVHLSFWGWSSRMRFQCGTESVLQQLRKGQCRHREHSANTVLTHSQRGQTLQKYSTKMCKVHLKVWHRNTFTASEIWFSDSNNSVATNENTRQEKFGRRSDPSSLQAMVLGSCPWLPPTVFGPWLSYGRNS